MNLLYAKSQLGEGSWRSFVGSVLGQRIGLRTQGGPPILGLMFRKRALVKMQTQNVEKGFGLAAIGFEGAHLEFQPDVFGAVAANRVGAFIACHLVHHPPAVKCGFNHERTQ